MRAYVSAGAAKHRGAQVISGVKTAVVTGGGHGIGRALCRRLHADGVEVVVADLDEQAATKVAAEISGVSFGVETNPRYPDAEPVPTTVLVNPAYDVIDDGMVSGWEGCLSVPGMRGYIPRHAAIRYRGFDQYGEAIEREAGGFHAIVFQHEFDHLAGILYPDKIVEHDKFGYEEELVAAGIF